MVRRAKIQIGRFLKATGGQIAVAFAVLLPMLAGITGGAMDLYIHNFQVTSLQNAADNAALAAAREASLKGWSSRIAKEVADSYLSATLANVGMNQATYTSHVTVDTAKRQVKVAVDQDHYGYFFLGYFKGSPQIRVSATAQTSGKTNVCVIGLDKSSSMTVNAMGSSKITASECAVYSNSGAPDGLSSIESAVVGAQLACSAGGYAGAPKNYKKMPVSDCPLIEDPLAHRKPPALSTSCTATKLKIKGTGMGKGKKAIAAPSATILSPGVYCNGLTIMQNAVVTMLPGIYVFRNGPFVVEQDAAVSGVGVGFYFTGPDARFVAKGGSVINFAAPKTGAMAGLLMSQDRKNTPAEFVVMSKKAANLLGTIYLPNGTFIVKTKNPIAEESAYTAIVARRLSVQQSTDLVLNANYDSTDVPVPDGVGPTSAQPRIVE